MSSTVISFQNVSFRYTNCESRSLSDVTLNIEKGECVLLCGASGCGKTTVTRLINGLIPHSLSNACTHIENGRIYYERKKEN